MGILMTPGLEVGEGGAGGRRGAGQGEECGRSTASPLNKCRATKGPRTARGPRPSHGSLISGQMVLMPTALSVNHDKQPAPAVAPRLVPGPRGDDDINVLVMK